MTIVAFPQPTNAARTAAPVRARWGMREWTMLRWAVRATLLLGVAASVAANVLHAEPNPISQAIAAWPPLALLFTVELIARVPVHRRRLAVARLLAATTIACIAAFVSYWHMVGVAAHYGETGASPYLLPLSVDGLIIVASISLVEISGRLHTTETAVTGMAPGATSIGQPETMPTPSAAPERAEHLGPIGGLPTAAPAPRPAAPVQPAALPTVPDLPTGQHTEPAPTSPGAVPHPQPEPERPTADAPATPPPGPDARQNAAVSSSNGAHPGDQDQGDVPTAPRDAIKYWQKRQPDIGIDDLARRVGKSPRQIRRYLDTPTTNTRTTANGHRNDHLAATFRADKPVTRVAAPLDPLACLGIALLLGVTAAVLAPRLTARWIPSGGRSWPTRLGIGATTAAAGGALTWRHTPNHPGEYAILAAWLTFATAGILLAVIDMSVRRLPTVIIAATSAAVALLIVGGAVLTGRPDVLVIPCLAAIILGGVYVVLTAVGASSVGMGDVRLAALTGLILGTAGWQSVMLGAVIPYLLAAPVALATLRHYTRGTASQIPFGPFLVGGAVLAGVLTATVYG
jgi:prepilin signal peptidase PulO-like enzyme (type II secretory pathway)